MVEGMGFLCCGRRVEMPLHPLHHVIGGRIDARAGVHDIWNDIIWVIFVERIKSNHQPFFLFVVQRCCCIAHACRLEYSAL